MHFHAAAIAELTFGEFIAAACMAGANPVEILTELCPQLAASESEE